MSLCADPGSPASFQRFVDRQFHHDDICAPGYRGRKRGEVVRTRTTVAQAHKYQWLGSFGNRRNRQYREELHKGLAAIGRYLTAYQLEAPRMLLRLDGHYGNGAVLADVVGFACVTRSKNSRLLDHPLIQAWSHMSPGHFQQLPECQTVRSLSDPLQRWVQHGKPVASLARILRSNPMERVAARQKSRPAKTPTHNGKIVA
jgi:hypothetical protein